jgi:methionyl-tRNA synthetase
VPKFYLTTPIYYANSRPHVGSAYTTIVCDVIARYKRMCGYDVAYLTGTDEHGVNIERAAEAQRITPQQLVDKNEKIFRELWKLLGITTTDFIRTTSPEHARAVQTLVRRTLERDKKLPPGERAIYKRKYEGRYCIYDNLFVSDTPHPIPCPTCGRPTELVSEENYFFRLSKYQQPLLEFYEKNPKFVAPDFRFNEVKSLVQSGLKDVSISRKTIKWGIPWPDDPEHVFYVWYDALTSYMSGIGYASENAEEQRKFERFWPADLHMIGKEIIRFHAVYWPAFLMAADLPRPKKIFAHGWLLFEQEKMSKSKGNIAYPEPIVKAFDDLTGAKVGNDALRYYLLRETVFGQDGNFSRDALITRYNADLANGLGNLANRTLTMIDRNLGGRVPWLEAGAILTRHPETTESFTHDNLREISNLYENFQFSQAVEKIWGLVATFDRYLATEKPWSYAEDASQRKRLEATLFTASEALRIVAILAHPVIPDATHRLWRQLGRTERLEAQRIDQVEWAILPGESRIGKPEAVLPRVDKKELSERIEAMENEIRNPGSAQSAKTSTGAAAGTAAGATPGASAPAASTSGAAPGANSKITIEDFAKVELRVGEIKSAERIQGADKLLKLLVDIGDEVRQVLAGIALAYAPEELIGRKVVIVANLAPRKMRGLESNGMLLAASVGTDGKPVLCTFAEDIAPGAKVK